MLITDVRTQLVEFPFDAPFYPAWARGRNMPALQMVLIRVETDEGITGIGAAHAGPEAMIAIDRFVKPYFVGEDPLAVERLTVVLRDAEILGPPLYCMEIPLWDIVGKRAGLPVYRLWGGYASRVEVYCATAEVRSAEQRVDDVQRLIDEGFKAVKLRFHRPDPRDDLAVVAAVRDAVGDRIEIMVDGNQAGVEPGHGGHETWGYRLALEVAHELERMGCYWLEEPLPRHNYDDLARLRDRLETLRVDGGEDNHGLHEFQLLLDRRCFDVLTPDALLSEGVFQLRKLAAIPPTAGTNVILVTHKPNIVGAFGKDLSDVREGEATIVGFKVMFQEMGMEAPGMKQIWELNKQAAGMDPAAAKAKEKMDKLPAYLTRNLMMSYEDGSIFVEEVLAKGGWEAVTKLFQDPRRVRT